MKDALVALGMGGPDSADSIKEFLYNLFSDRSLINFHMGNTMQKLIAKMIATSRTKKVTPEYIKMGFGGASPQSVYNKKLLEKVKSLYEKSQNIELDTYSAMCYYKPFIKDTMKEINDKGYRRVIFFPLYPHYSSTTVGACYLKLIKNFNGYKPASARYHMINHWYTNKKYCECIQKRILEASLKLGKDIKDCHVIFSAHSIPQKIANKGDVYINQIESHVETITKSLQINKWEITYQSKVGPVKWVRPTTVEMIKKHKIIHTDNIIIVPISFISDHIETLIEIDEHMIKNSNDTNIVRSASLNDDDDFAEAVNDIICGVVNE